MWKKLIKYILYALLTFFSALVILLAIPYIISPVYEFASPKPFSGQSCYNPYQQLDSSWTLANFHAHSRSWGGLTDGRSTHIDSILKVYRQAGFSHIGISNYQNITQIQEEGIASIPTYEHGYNIKKRHHLCLGTDKVCWLDFVFFQTLSHKQYVLNDLRSTTDFLAINHPRFCNGFDEADFTRLSNYDAVEVLNHYRTSIPHWDSALAAGYYAVLLANVDMHDLTKANEVGGNFTVVNTGSIERYDIIQALKAGRHYGVKVNTQPDENIQKKRDRNASLICPESINMQNDTLHVRLNRPVAAMRFVGQNGAVKKTAAQTDTAMYRFTGDDTYIRLEAEDDEGNLFLFNPIVKTDDKYVVNPSKWTVNVWKTTVKRTAILLVFLLFVFRFYSKKRETIRAFFRKPYRLQLFILLILSTLVRAFLAASTELNNDEVYYRLYAMYPDFSHFDHPPMIGWLIQLTSLNLLLDSEFFIRLGALISGSANLVLAFKTGQKIHSHQAGFIAAVLLCISPYISLISGMFILPDTPLSFFWMLALYLAVSIFEGEITAKKANRLLILGLLIGLATLSKYTAMFLWLGTGLYIIMYQRTWFKHWQLYLAAAITLCCALPVVFWNLSNDFISFTFHGERVSFFSRLCMLCFSRELLGECFYNNPFIFVMVYRVLYKNIVKKTMTASFRLFYCIGLPIVAVFLFFSLFRDTLPHWNALGYTTLIFPVAVYITEKLQAQRKRLWIQVKIWGFVILSGLAVFELQLHYDVFRLRDNDMQDFTLELSTWKKTGTAFAEMSQKIEKQGVIQAGAPIIASRWFPAANLDMYVAKPTNRKVLATGRLDDIHKYAWINVSRGGFTPGMDAWYITDDYDFIDSQRIAEYFTEIFPVEPLYIKRNGESCKTVYVYILKNLKKTAAQELNGYSPES